MTKNKLFRNKVNNKKNIQRHLFMIIWILLFHIFLNNDKRKFWKVTRHFVKKKITITFMFNTSKRRQSMAF